MGRIVHFEIHAENMQRAADFYGKLFGWKFDSWGDGTYWLITTGPDDKMGINGGMAKREGPVPKEGQPMNGFVNIVDVENIDEHIKKILKAGGVLALDKMPIPGMGYSAYFKDPEGNTFGIFQEDSAAK